MSIRIRLLLLLFTIHCSLFTAMAQITGQVTDAQTGEPIPFASVQYK